MREKKRKQNKQWVYLILIDVKSLYECISSVKPLVHFDRHLNELSRSSFGSIRLILLWRLDVNFLSYINDEKSTYHYQMNTQMQSTESWLSRSCWIDFKYTCFLHRYMYRQYLLRTCMKKQKFNPYIDCFQKPVNLLTQYHLKIIKNH